MANITPEKRLELSGRAVQIRDAVQDGENTQYRVGSLLEEIVEYLGGSSSGPGPTPVELEGILASLNGKDNPLSSEPNRILEWDGSKWNYIPTPTGGSGGGITLNQVWDSLAANDGNSNYHQIHPSHLLNALADYVSNTKLKSTEDLYTWWGRRMVEDQTTHKLSVSGNMTGVGSITFTNNVRIVPEENKTLRIEDATGNSIAHIYATGGVSALGNSSSGGGTPTPGGSELHYLLQFINSYDSYSSDINPNNIEDGSTLRWNGNNWIIDKTAFDDIAWQNVTGTSGYLKKTNTQGVISYTWSPVESSTVSLDNLWAIGDVGGDSDYTYPIAPGHILQYGNNKWNNVAFGINAGTANSILSSITLGSNTYSLPQANGNAMGIVKAGDGLSASSGIMSLTAATTSALGGIKIGYTQNDKNYPVKLSNNQAYVNVPWTDTTYEGGYGITVSSNLSSNNKYPISAVAAPGGGLAVDSTGIKINPDTNKRVLWGNQDTLVDDIGKSGDNKSLSYVQDISMYGSIVMNTKNSQIQMADPTGATRNVFNLTDKNQQDVYYGNTTKAFLDVGYGCARVTTGDNKSALRLWGDDILFKANGSDNNNRNTMILTKEGSTYLPLATTGPKSGNTYTGAGPAAGLRIGDAVLYWDEANQALALAKYNTSQPSSPTAANFYATGGVSALGMSSGIGTIPTMTFGNLTVNNTLNVGEIYLNDTIYAENNDIDSVGALDAQSINTSSITIGEGVSVTKIALVSISGNNKLRFVIGNQNYDVSYTNS